MVARPDPPLLLDGDARITRRVPLAAVLTYRRPGQRGDASIAIQKLLPIRLLRGRAVVADAMPRHAIDCEVGVLVGGAP